MALYQTLRKWIGRLNFARYLRSTTEGDGEVCLTRPEI